MSKELKKYIESAMEKGAAKEQIVQTLVTAGWSKDVINKVIGDFSGVDSFGVPIPAPKMQAHHLARDIFVYFIILVTLGISAFAVGALFFNIIHYLFDNLTKHRYYFKDISWSIAQIIIAYPIFISLSYWVNNDLKKFPQKREAIIRKLMIYFILAITAVVGISDLIWVLGRFLRGELTTPFILETIVVLGISGLIFAYYFYEVREDDNLIKINKDEKQ